MSGTAPLVQLSVHSEEAFLEGLRVQRMLGGGEPKKSQAGSTNFDRAPFCRCILGWSFT